MQDAWWICVLRPNSVATGSTDRQLDFVPQSPQPSQIRSLIMTFAAGVGHAAAALAPLLGRALLVVDQHGHARHRGQLLLAVDQSVAMADLDRPAAAGPAGTGRVVGGHDDRGAPLRPAASATRPGTGIPPTGSWPPVIATAELYSSL